MTRAAALILAAFLAGIIVGRATSRPAQPIPAPASSSTRILGSRTAERTEAPGAGESAVLVVGSSGCQARDPSNGRRSPGQRPAGSGDLDPCHGAETAGASISPEPRSAPPATRAPGLIEGVASWYDAGRGLYAALPGPWKPGRRVLLCGPDGECFGAPVVTRCGCLVGTARARIVDVSPALFAKLAPLSAGLVRVRMTVFG